MEEVCIGRRFKDLQWVLIHIAGLAMGQILRLQEYFELLGRTICVDTQGD